MIADSRDSAEAEPEYGTLNWVTLCALKLTANKVLTNVERKKLYLQTLVLLITGNAAKHTDLAIVMGILSVVKTWLLNPVVVHVPGKPSEYISLTEKVCLAACRLPVSSSAEAKVLKHPMEREVSTLYDQLSVTTQHTHDIHLPTVKPLKSGRRES